jgi:ACT domain-containing protein
MSRNKANDKRIMIGKLEKMPIVEIACKQTGLSRATYYRWRRDDEIFSDDCDEAIEHSSAMINDMAESQLIQSIKDKNMTAIVFWLKHHHKNYETRVNVQGVIKHQADVLTDEQSEIVERALKLAGLIKAEDVQDETVEI